MPLLLVGVTGPEDATLALAHGADIVHVTGPDGGPASPDAVRATVAAVCGRCPVSALADVPDAAAIVDAGAGMIQVRFSPGLDPSGLAALAPRTRLIGVILTGEEAALPLMAASGFAGAALEAGQGARLLDRMDIAAIADFVDAAHAHGLQAILAGKLETPDVPRLLLLGADALAFCRTPLDAGRLDIIRALVPAQEAERTEPDVRRRPARAAEPRRDEPTDRIFVRDFVLPVRIGAYAREHDMSQNVRFNVDVRVLRQGHAAADMRDVFSYDIITDSIRMIVAREHIALVETLAERIAAVVLAYPRIASVTVRVEKLDTGPAGVGVEITRERPAESATVHQLFPVSEP